jgi:hypothetical protein
VSFSWISTCQIFLLGFSLITVAYKCVFVLPRKLKDGRCYYSIRVPL